MTQENNSERALLIGVCLPDQAASVKAVAMDELARLADTAGMIVRDRYIQNRGRISGKTFAGEGFIHDCLGRIEGEIDLLVFDNNLTGSQAHNLEVAFGVEAIDRTELILRIFHDHARTKEAKLQVRLAELKYQLPKLKRLWTHLDRERGTSRMGGGAASRGMGEKQIEKDRQAVQREIYEIEKHLEKFSKQMDTQRKLRRRNCWNVGLVGYTNTGKSTLFNRLTHSDVPVRDKLFATLDSTSRSLDLSGGRDIILSDTVGFVADLPHHLVASFRATLREAEEADLLIHVADISDEDLEKHMADVDRVLEAIGAHRIPRLLVLNKIDKVDQTVINGMKRKYPEALVISARQGTHMEELLEEVDERINRTRQYELKIPQTQQKAVSDAHTLGKITKKAYDNDFVRLTVEMSAHDIKGLGQYIDGHDDNP
ncbi:MAG: GTPase HflX [Deltaproteobacteria bacterium]|nr:GTPase HflX [Deltaproteobacteria bacterium]